MTMGLILVQICGESLANLRVQLWISALDSWEKIMLYSPMAYFHSELWESWAISPIGAFLGTDTAKK